MPRRTVVWKLPVSVLAEMYANGVTLDECAAAGGVARKTMTKALREMGVPVRPSKPYRAPVAYHTATKSRMTLQAKVASLDGQVRYWKGKAREYAESAKPTTDLTRQVAYWRQRAERAEHEIQQWEQRWREAAVKWRRQMGLSRVA